LPERSKACSGLPDTPPAAVAVEQLVFTDETGDPGLHQVPQVGKVLLMSTSAERRAWAARTLATAGQVSAYAYLRRALWDTDEDVRLSVVQAVGQLGVSQAAAELAAVYAWSGPRVRREIVRAIMRMEDGGGRAGILFLAAGDEDREVRALAARAKTRFRKSVPVAFSVAPHADRREKTGTAAPAHRGWVQRRP
jgi:hypothetical protein